ncbi:MAG: CPCC family cysteine-rich protein [Polyangiaceae bacterium]
MPNDDEARRRAWFARYVEMLTSSSVVAGQDGGPHRCPCCRRLTLGERGGFEICPVCFWEDDGQDDHDADVVRGGPNGALSLTNARESYLRIGACDERALPHVRAPRPEED